MGVPDVLSEHGRAASVTSLLDQARYGVPEVEAASKAAAATGFTPLDRALGGGFRPGDLSLVAGEPGVGKTIATLQWASTMARAGRHVVYVCYEHDAPVLLGRLLCLEVGMQGGDGNLSGVESAAEAVRGALLNGLPLVSLADQHPLIGDALQAITDYADRLHLVRGSGTHTDIGRLTDLVRANGQRPVLFIDYLQKISVRPEPETENEKVLRSAEGLKELALTEGIPVITVAAAAAAGLEARRLRVHHLRGSSAVAYEADVALIMNEKYNIVSKTHVAFDPVRAAAFKHSVVFSIEKNRGGPAALDLEFTKHFASYRFDPVGRFVQERLVDERVTLE